MKNIPTDEQELDVLCSAVRDLVNQKKYQECELMIKEAMGKYPHAPEPHNLIGILYEKSGDHLTAMKHFRAAWALDPAYIPVRCNMENFSSFSPKGQYAFDYTDCPDENQKNSDRFKHKDEIERD